ncbi:hypothetical protein GCM10011380_18770 [Sphingomonas metalli]|uniref:Ferritin-like domain-containing protein n=1 Tax=Sphingomonas metalli TaxID=1779358 RepID=A0A916WTY8_9SPHN|nr:ferritin-like domain-containing protein [Sphingomonas metalli]GGB29498.1 hypothetical protein GCM10011380_18770 [Sphingomonas metalli]
MTEERFILDVIEEASAKRRTERRRFMKMAGGAAAAAGGLSLLAACNNDDDRDVPVATPTPTPAAVSEVDVLNFALQLEYLEANFYSYAAFGQPIASTLRSGTGTPGSVQIVSGTTAGQPRAVSFQDPIVAAYAREIAADEIAHVTFLRTALGGSAAAQPAINISGDATGAFTAAARAAGVVGSGATFDPYADDNSFLLGAYLFEDVGVTAYMGGVQLLSTPAYIEAAAGIHAVEAYHAGLVRTVLYRKGLTTASIFTATQQISDARDSLDGTSNTGLLNQGGDRDQGIIGSSSSIANIVPTDSNGIVYVRSPQQVLNIVYLNATSTNGGGFFPAGVNGSVRSS